MARIFQHPLKDGVIQILEKHFAPEIVKKFKLVFEAQSFQGDNIKKQLLDDNLSLEVYYVTKESTEYICDIWSSWSHMEAEAYLLKMITDAAKSGKIGKNWIESKDGRISEDVASGKYETPDSEITKYMKKGGE